MKESDLNKNNSGSGVTHFLQAFGWSIAGLTSAIKHETAFRQELVLVCILAPLGLWLGNNGVERALLLGSLLLVLIVELLNSAVESVVDRISTEHHHLSGRAKDLGSAAVFVSLANSTLIWICILFF